MDRIGVINRLDIGENTFDRYISALFDIYHIFNDNRSMLSSSLQRDICIFGGILYFAIFKEALSIGIDFEDIDREIFQDFLKFKTVDIDMFSDLPTKFEEEFVAMDKCEISQKVHEIFKDAKDPFDTVSDLLELRRSDDSSPLQLLDGRFSIDTIIMSERFCVRVLIDCYFENYNEHIFEMSIQFTDEEMESYVIYDLKSVRKPFLGRNIIVSCASQIFPRQWRDIDDIYIKPASEIYSELKKIFHEDNMASLKFKQGFYRTYMTRYIFSKTIGYDRFLELQKIMIPSRKTLSNLLFFFRGNLVRNLTPQILDRVVELRRSIPDKDDEPADPMQILKFLDIGLDAWKIIDDNIRVAY